jgi:hydrogenase maturation factor
MSHVARTSIAEPAEQATDEPISCITCGDVALPMRVLALGDDGLARCVTEAGASSDVDVSLVDAAPGDDVLVHACVAIRRLERDPT